MGLLTTLLYSKTPRVSNRNRTETRWRKQLNIKTSFHYTSVLNGYTARLYIYITKGKIRNVGKCRLPWDILDKRKIRT